METAETLLREQPKKIQRGYKTSSQQISTSICRGCLATGVEMREATLLNSVFKNLTGINVLPKDMLCYECSALLRKYDRFRSKILISQDMLTRCLQDCVPFTKVNVASPHLTRSSVHTYEYLAIQTEQVEERFLPDVSDNPVVVKRETVEVKEEPLHDCDAITKEWREPSPFTSELWRSKPVKCYSKKKRTVMPKTEVQTEQTEKGFDLLSTQAASVESLVVTEAARHSLRARLRFDDDIYTHIPEETTLTTPINTNEDTTEGDIQEHFLEHGFMKFEVENPSDRDDYTCNYEIYSDSHQVHDKYDATSLHDSDEAEEDIKCNTYSDGSVNSISRSNVQSYICDARNQSISDENLLSEHIREHSAEKSFKCDVCFEHFPNYSALTKHSHEHTAAKVYRCDVCKKRYRHKHNIVQHLRKHTNKTTKVEPSFTVVHTYKHLYKRYKCDVCMKCFSRKQTLSCHMRVHTGDKPYKCDICMKCFGQKSDLNKHMRIHTGDKPYKCDVCMKCFAKKYDLKKHVMRLHTGDKPYKCDVCLKCFCEKRNLNKHIIRVHTDDEPYKCDVCLKCFSQKQHLSFHMRLHTGDKPYKCDICMKCFTYKDNLTKHKRVHTGYKPYKCDVCMKFFSRKQTLSFHMRVHTGDKPYKCDICMKCFTYKDNLTKHKRVHTGYKPYKCDVCLKCFSQKQHLSNHMRVHTGDKPYKCDICMKCFGQKCDLNKHMRIHTGDKPYKCDVCMKCFSRKQTLSCHMRVHTGDKPYKCDVCMKCFAQKSNLTKHIRVHTPVTSHTSVMYV